MSVLTLSRCSIHHLGIDEQGHQTSLRLTNCLHSKRPGQAVEFAVSETQGPSEMGKGGFGPFRSIHF